MTASTPPYGEDQRCRPRVDARQLWSGGVATAVVAGLIALVGVFVCRWLIKIPLLAPKADGAYGNVHTTDFVLAAAFAALVATALAHLLLLSTPRPMTFFGWIVALVTLAAVLFPFSTTAPLEAKAATAVVELVIGIAIGTLISGVAARAVRPRGPAVPSGRYPPQAPEVRYWALPPDPSRDRYGSGPPTLPEDQYRVVPPDSPEGPGSGR
ncbi:MAG: DUF6069 family protein [Streptosporangiaceae bacterium]